MQIVDSIGKSLNCKLGSMTKIIIVGNLGYLNKE